jgi:hypothetical protein
MIEGLGQGWPTPTNLGIGEREVLFLNLLLE